LQAAGWTPSDFNNESPYSIMFGPDKCGSTNKVHFIFRHKNPKTGKYVEHHLTNPPMIINDKLSHVYTAVIYPDHTLKILIDGEEKKTANLLSNTVSTGDEKSFRQVVVRSGHFKQIANCNC
jgi:calnexin